VCNDRHSRLPSIPRHLLEELKNYRSTPLAIVNFWLGWAGEGMSDLYDKIRHDVAFRKEVAEKAGRGVELPRKKLVVGPKIENEVVLEMAASA
jgi:hypothetical protein